MYNRLSNILYQNNKKLKTYYEPDEEEEIRPFNIDEYKENDIVEKPSILPLQIFRSIEDDDLSDDSGLKDAEPVKVKDEIDNDDIQPKSSQIQSFKSNTKPNQYHYELNRFNNISGDDLITREAHEEAKDNANYGNATNDLMTRLFEGDDETADQQMIEYLLKNDVKAQQILEKKKPRKLNIQELPVDDIEEILSNDPTYKSTKNQRKIGKLKKYKQKKQDIIDELDDDRKQELQQKRDRKRQIISDLLDEEKAEDEATIKIQKVARGFKGRKQAQQKREQAEELKKLNKASTQIQKVARGVKGRSQAEKARKRKEIMDMYLGKDNYDDTNIQVAEVIENLPEPVEEVKEEEFKEYSDEVKLKEYQTKVKEINDIFVKKLKPEEYIFSKSSKYKVDDLWDIYKYMLYTKGKNKEILKIQDQIIRDKQIKATRNKKITRQFLIDAIADII